MARFSTQHYSTSFQIPLGNYLTLDVLPKLADFDDIGRIFLRFVSDLRAEPFTAGNAETGSVDGPYQWPRVIKYGRWGGPLLQGHLRTAPSTIEEYVPYSFYGGPQVLDSSNLAKYQGSLSKSSVTLDPDPDDKIFKLRGDRKDNALNNISTRVLPSSTLAKGIPAVIHAHSLFTHFNDVVLQQMAIGYVSYAYKIYGTGGNLGSKTPANYLADRTVTLFHSERAVSWLNTSGVSIGLSSLNNVVLQRGDAFANPETSGTYVDWVITTVYGTSDHRRNSDGNLASNWSIPKKRGTAPWLEPVIVGRSTTEFYFDTTFGINLGVPIYDYRPRWRFWPGRFRGPNDTSGSELTRNYTSTVHPDAANVNFRAVPPFVSREFITTRSRNRGPGYGSNPDIRTLRGAPSFSDPAYRRVATYTDLTPQQLDENDPVDPWYPPLGRVDTSQWTTVDPAPELRPDFIREYNYADELQQFSLDSDGHEINYPTLKVNAYAGNIITKTSIETTFRHLMYRLKFHYEYNLVLYEQAVCHASCHSSCHGSRGRR